VKSALSTTFIDFRTEADLIMFLFNSSSINLVCSLGYYINLLKIKMDILNKLYFLNEIGK